MIQKRRSFGFTLIELLIVMAILGILSVIGMGNFQSTRIKARDASRKSDLQTIAKSIEAYVNDHGSYPISDVTGKIICKTDGSVCNWGASFQDDKSTLYTAKLPSDPAGYLYFYSSTGTTYTLYAYLENAQDASLITPPIATPLCGTLACNYQVKSSNQL